MTSRLAAGVFALTLTTSTPAAAQAHFPSDEAIREIARQAGTVSGKVGIVIGVLEADGTRRVITVGDAPYDGRTLFEIGSITKVFTGILLAEMAERGDVRLEQPVAELLPGDVVVPSRNGRQIRLVDLSTHSSGLPRMPDNFTPADPGNPYVDYTAAKLYDFLRRHELRRDIGVEAEYSNVGVGLLGHALARRAGTSYEALVTARILDPLKMTSTKVTLSPADVARLAPGHDARGQQVQNWDLAEAFAGAGSLRSNVDDMLTFLAANLTPPGSSTLGRAIRSAQTAHFKAAGGRQGGLGWGRSLLKQERNVLDPYRRHRRLSHVRRARPGTASWRGRPLQPYARPGRRPDASRHSHRSALAGRANSCFVRLDRVAVQGAARHPGAAPRSRRVRRVAPDRRIQAPVNSGGGRHDAGADCLDGSDLRCGGLPHAPFPAGTADDAGGVRAAVVLSVGLGVSPVGRRLAAGLPLAVLVGVQGFRLPLELLMHRAYEDGLMPVQMSYSGLNFDIVTGITALIVGALLATGRAGVPTARAWNVMGTLLLVNIISIALLSAPTPWRVFRDGPANVWITTVPYVWLPTVMVAFAILGHIVIYRRLRAGRD